MVKIQHSFKKTDDNKIIVTSAYTHTDGSGYNTVSLPTDKKEKIEQLQRNNAIYLENIENQKREIAANKALIAELNKLIAAEIEN